MSRKRRDQLNPRKGRKWTLGKNRNDRSRIFTLYISHP